MIGGDKADTIAQRTIVGGPRFCFHEDHLSYFGVQYDFRIRYRDIPNSVHFRQVRKDSWLPPLTVIYFLLVAVALLRHHHDPHYGAAGLYWLLSSLAGFLLVTCSVVIPLHYVTKKEYTAIPTKNGNLWVAKGKGHDEIIEQIQRRRLQSLRRLSASDPANSPEEEVNKLKWLRHEEAITEEEYSELVGAQQGG